MIILDTNVLSALMQQQPDPQVVAWLDEQRAESVWISSVTLFEGRYGLALMPAGQRKALGRPVDMRDTFIAGIALASRATLATRNTKHFDDLTTPVVNPWAV